MSATLRIDVVDGPGAAALADLVHRHDPEGLLDIRLVERAGVAGLVIAAEPRPEADTVLGLTDVTAFVYHRALPLAERMAGRTGSRPVPPVLHDHDPRWAVTADRYLSRLGLALDAAGLGRDVRYEHIGSTAVPGLRAKAFIDLQLGVPVLPGRDGAFDAAVRTCGFLPAVGARPDSPGVDHDLEMFADAGSPDDYRKRLFYRPDPVAPSILHVRRLGTAWHDYPIAFRDLLRTSPRHLAEYQHVKEQAQRAHADDPDYDDYTRAKGDVIRRALIDAGCAPAG